MRKTFTDNAMGMEPTRHHSSIPIGILVAGALCMGLVPMAGCSLPFQTETTGEVPVSVTHIDGTDATEVAKDIFPTLDGIESVEMEQVRIGGTQDRDLVPGPADYSYQGYIELSSEAIRGYAESYDFLEGSVPQVEFHTVGKRDGQWHHCHALCEAVIKPGLFGDIWMDGNTVLFHVYTM